MPILLHRISTKGGRWGQKSPKSCLHRIRMSPNNLIFSCLIDCVGKLKCIKKKCDTEGELGSFCSAHAQCR